MRRAAHFAAVALPRLGPLCDQMRLTLGETHVAYTLLLAEVLSHYSVPDRTTIIQKLPAMLLQLAQQCEQSRAEIPAAGLENDAE
jgi:outer membrane murein-binding lipoprotein Lpp